MDFRGHHQQISSHLQTMGKYYIMISQTSKPNMIFYLSVHLRTKKKEKQHQYQYFINFIYISIIVQIKLLVYLIYKTATVFHLEFLHML